MEIIRFCEKDASFTGNRRGVGCPLASAPADYLSARRADCVGSDASQFAEQRAGIRFRCFPFETPGALRGRWTAIALENLPIRSGSVAGANRSGDRLGPDVRPTGAGSIAHKSKHALLLVRIQNATSNRGGTNCQSRDQYSHHSVEVGVGRSL